MAKTADEWNDSAKDDSADSAGRAAERRQDGQAPEPTIKDAANPTVAEMDYLRTARGTTVGQAYPRDLDVANGPDNNSAGTLEATTTTKGIDTTRLNPAPGGNEIREIKGLPPTSDMV